MTPPYKLQIASLNNKSTQAIDLLASEIHKGDWHVPTVIAGEKVATHFEFEWNRLTGGQSEYGMRQRIYELRVVGHHDYPRGSFRRATMEEIWTALQGGKTPFMSNASAVQLPRSTQGWRGP